MKRLCKYISALWLCGLMLTGCHELPDYQDDPRGNFEALWSEFDRHYCFFDSKGVDWNRVHDRYAARVHDQMTGPELFQLCSEMAAELRDGHVNISSPYGTSYYRGWWSDYPQNYDARLVQQYYFNFNYTSLGAVDYGMLPQNVGYIHYSSFSSSLGEGNIDYILSIFSTAQALIFDVRDNPGGDLTNVELWVRRFLTERTCVGSISHKTGPGHHEFSNPHDIWYNPVDPARHVVWIKPVYVLANRSTFSAANNFVSVMKYLPNVTIVGATTGGGCGMPYSSEIPCGWGVRMSAVVIRDASGLLTEQGVEPSEGCAVDMDPADALNGKDSILDFAIALATTN